MTATDAVEGDTTDAVEGGTLRTVARVMQAGLAAIVVYALVTLQADLAINSAIPLAITFVPAVVRRRHGHEMHPGLVLWIATAAFLHAVGALGPYRMFGWYDQVAHTVSAALVAGVGYAFARAVDRHHDDIQIPSKLRFVFVLAFGVLWEILEFASGGVASVGGGSPVLAQYGVDDVVYDLLFNTVGGVVAALWGTGYFDGVADVLARQMGGPERSV